VDLSLHKPPIAWRKRLKQVILFGSANDQAKLLMDVNKPRELRDGVARALFTAT
jgi:hypothetical protein